MVDSVEGCCEVEHAKSRKEPHLTVVCSNQQITEHLRYLMKYADDTYVIIPACNVDSRQLEMDHIGEWAERNNLVLNLSKSAEIVFTDNRKRRSVVPPSPLTDIARVQSLKVLGVTISSSLSLSEHVNSDEVAGSSWHVLFNADLISFWTSATVTVAHWVIVGVTLCGTLYSDVAAVEFRTASTLSVKKTAKLSAVWVPRLLHGEGQSPTACG